MTKDSFDLVRVLGKGSFGKVCAQRVHVFATMGLRPASYGALSGAPATVDVGLPGIRAQARLSA